MYGDWAVAFQSNRRQIMKTNIQTANLSSHRNQPALRVRSSVKAGGVSLNHNQTVR